MTKNTRLEFKSYIVVTIAKRSGINLSAVRVLHELDWVGSRKLL
jgi:hypothetical protein